MKKLFIFASIVIALSLILVSCAAPTPTPSPTPPAKTPLPPAAKTPTKAEWEVKWEKLISAAKQEGTVVMYGPVGPILKEKLGQALEKTYGIKLETVVGRPPEVAQKYLTERSANLTLADVLMTGQTTTLTMIKPKGVLTSPKPHLILPEVLDPNVWHGGSLPFLDKDELALSLIATYDQFIVVNTELVKEGQVSTYSDFLQPKWKAKITLYDPSLPGKGGTWLAYTLLKVFGRVEGEKYLRQLATQDLALTRDMRLHGETIARGKYAIGIGGDAQVVADLAKAGAPIAWAKMKEDLL
jgi:ABC-type Fe3+ transport system substrate-binding protein